MNEVRAVLCLQQRKTCDILICCKGKLGFCAKLVKNMSDRYSEIGPRCNEWALVIDPLVLKALAVARMHLATTSRHRLRTVNFSLRVMFWMVETMSTRYNDIGPRYNEQARYCELLLLKALAAARMDLIAMKRLRW